MKRKKADIPVYSFAEHQRQPQTTTLYSPRVLILEGILALHPQIVDLLDVKVYYYVQHIVPISLTSSRFLLKQTWMSVLDAEVGNLFEHVMQCTTNLS